MAIRKDKKDLSALQLVGRKDDALDPVKAKDAYDAYVAAGLDESKLVFLPDQQPTRFLLNFELTGKEAERIKNAMVAGKDEDGEPTMSLGSWQFALAKRTLKGIQNPTGLDEADGLKFETDQNGLVSDALLGKLDKHGIIQDIFSAYSVLVLVTAKGTAAKN